MSWDDTKLGDIVFTAGGSAFPHSFQGQKSGELPFFKVSDMNLPGNEVVLQAANNYVSRETAASLRAKVAPEGAVVFPKIGETLRSNKKRILGQESLFDNNVMGVWPKDVAQLDPQFLYYLLLQVDLNDLASDGAVPSITGGAVKNVIVRVPGISSQRAIVQVMKTITEALQARRRELALERERKAALMHHLFTHGTRGEPIEQTEIGEMPESWEVEPLGQHVADGPQNGIYKHQDEYGSGTPIVRINDFDNDGAFVTADFQRVRLTPVEDERYRLSENDLLINRVNSLSHLGKSALVPALSEATVFESNMMRLRVNPDTLSSGFLLRFLTLPGTRDRMRQMAKLAVAQASINQGDVKSLLVPFPCLEEQRRIEQVLDIQVGQFKPSHERQLY